MTDAFTAPEARLTAARKQSAVSGHRPIIAKTTTIAVLLVALTHGLAACYASLPTRDLFGNKMSALGDRSTRPGRAPQQYIGPIAGNTTDQGQFTGAVAEGTGTFVAARPAFTSEKTVAGEDGITLNLVDAPVGVIAKTVLGDILGVSFMIDPGVSGTMTLQTTHAVTRDTLVEILETTLRANGAAIAERGGIYRIVPSSSAIALTPRVTVPSLSGRGPGVIVQVVQIEHVSAEQMKDVLEPMVPQGSILRVDNKRNFLILAGTRSELSAMRDTISVFDVDWMRGMSFALLPVSTSSPEAITAELDTIFDTRSGPLKDVIRFLPNDRLSAILVVSSQPKYIRDTEKWVRKLDTLARSTEDQLFVYDIQNRPARELAALLQSILAAEAGQANGEANNVAPNFAAARVSTDDAAEANAQGGPFVAPQSGVAARVVADDANNSLLIFATARQYRRIQKILLQLDAVRSQVLLEAVIAEVALNDELKFGLRWFFENGNIKLTFSDLESGGTGSTFPGFSWMFSSTNAQVTLNALSSVTDVNVISSPTLMVLDNKTATLQVGDQVPIVTQSAQSVTDPDAPVVNSVELRDTGVILEVTPRVNDSGRVILDITQEVSNVVRTTTSGIDSPTIQQRKITTSVVVNDGENVALGGLMQESDTFSRSKVPLLGDIPWVGNAFKNKTDTIDRKELIIFIKPRVVRNFHEARRVTEEFRQQLDLEAPNIRKGRTRLERDIKRLGN